MGRSLTTRLAYVLIRVSCRALENVMAYIRLPLGIRVAVEYEAFGKVVVNVYHVTTTSPIVTAQLINIADLFIEWWDDTQKAGLSPDIAMTAVTCLNLDVENGEKIVQVVSPPIPGTATGAAMPNNVALVISFATTLTGRSFRGRSYMAGLREIDVTGNNIPIATAAGLVANYFELEVLLGLDNVDMVVASFVSGGAPRAEGIATRIDSVSCNTRVDTQRRRLPD